jgi:HPt (histidine-containing phosphotransfer) domain-containing protein
MEDAPVLVSELARHVRSGDQIGISEVLHKLKGLVANFHAAQLVHQLEAGETAAKEGRTAIDQSETERIAQQIDQIGDELTSFLAANKKR